MHNLYSNNYLSISEYLPSASKIDFFSSNFELHGTYIKKLYKEICSDIASDKNLQELFQRLFFQLLSVTKGGSPRFLQQRKPGLYFI